MAVYTWGANSHGQLGLGFESELCMSPQLLNKFSFSPMGVRAIRGGGGHVLVLDNCGRIHSCGWNNRGQLGLDSVEECHNEFQCIPGEFFGDVPVERLACGWDISGCITKDKRLFVWGSNAYQQLGICQRGFTAVRRPLHVTLPRDENPSRISFGLRHCAVLSESHVVYIFGRLRIADPPPMELIITATTLNKANVVKVQAAPESELTIVNIYSGQNHLLLKLRETRQQTGSNSSKRIIALGDNKFGQSNSFHFEQDIKQVAAGWTHNAVMLNDNRIFLWGRNCYGQLGVGSISDTRPVPEELKLPSDSAVPAHIYLGSEHALLRTSEGAVYTWGWNEHGNCGNDDTDNLCSPTLINLPSACKVAGTGAGFCIAICESA